MHTKIIDSIKWMKNILVSNKQEICSRNILELNDDTDEKWDKIYTQDEWDKIYTQDKTLSFFKIKKIFKKICINLITITTCILQTEKIY